jgi:chemotaxis protein methyltransferase CheR
MENAFVYRKKINVPILERRAQIPANPAPSTPRHVEQAKPDMAWAPKPVKPKISEDLRNPDAIFDETLALAVNKDYQAALLKLDQLLEKNKNFKRAYSLKASIHLNMQNVAKAQETVKELLAVDEWDVEGLLLSGIIAKTKESAEDAVRHFKGAVYIKPNCWLAHFYLAELYYGADDARGAAYEYGVTAGIIEKDATAHHGLTYFPIAFPPEQIVKLCRHNIKRISGDARKSN